MDLSALKTLVGQRKQYTEQIVKINGYLAQQYEAVIVSGDVEALKELSSILSGKDTSALKSEVKSIKHEVAPVKVQQTPSRKEIRTETVRKTKSKKETIAKLTRAQNKKNLADWQEKVNSMSRVDLRENKAYLAAQIKDLSVQAENAQDDSIKAKYLISVRHYMTCLGIVNTRIEKEESNKLKQFEAAQNAIKRADITKNKKLIASALPDEKKKHKKDDYSSERSESDDDTMRTAKMDQSSSESVEQTPTGKTQIRVRGVIESDSESSEKHESLATESDDSSESEEAVIKAKKTKKPKKIEKTKKVESKEVEQSQESNDSEKVEREESESNKSEKVESEKSEESVKSNKSEKQ